MSPSTNPAIVLVHGAWHVPQHYESFIEQLKQAGFDVYCPLLPTCDESKRAKASMYADAQLVREQVQSLADDGRRLIMLAHSYGGAVGTEAIKGLSEREKAGDGRPGGVVHLIYMCGFMLQIGECVGGASLPRPDPDPVEHDEAGTTFLCEPPRQLFFADVDPELAIKMEGLLVRQSGPAMTDPLTYAAWQHVPTTYLRTTEDQVLFLEWQDRQIKAVEEAGFPVTVETFNASHSPYISIQSEMIDAVKRVLERGTKE